MGEMGVRNRCRGCTEHINKEAATNYLLNCQNPDGGFGLHSGEESNLPGTCHTLLGLDVLKAVDKVDKENCTRYIIGLQHPDGGFSCPLSPSPNESDLKATCLAVLSLGILDDLDKMNETACIDYVIACQNPDGGFGFGPGEGPNMMATGLATWALDTLGKLGLMDEDSCVDFIASCQDPEGGFKPNPNIPVPNAMGTGMAVLSLERLDRLDIVNRDLCVNFVAGLQREEGNFSFASQSMPMMEEKVPKSAITYGALACLKTLDGLDEINLDASISYIIRCQNPDGGFGGCLGAKSDARDTAHGVMALHELPFLY
jgi:geranylgeranyl transferase type-2 subunit beta